MYQMSIIKIIEKLKVEENCMVRVAENLVWVNNYHLIVDLDICPIHIASPHIKREKKVTLSPLRFSSLFPPF